MKLNIKTEHIMPATGLFCLGLLLGVLLFTLIFMPQYQREVNRVHYADEVIKECIEYYPDFDDVIGEGDAYCEYVLSKQYR